MNLQDLIIKKFQKLTSKKVTLQSSLAELKIDSLSLAELVYEAEQELNIRVTDEDLLKINTIEEVIEIIQKAQNK
ncbi:phosphopantetheine-binding protein [Mycoplasmopsis lipofaciens]|uniref:phosphopantetheine-binding protein n=1 Tax=Mycoplasmopsis lipofaciens TaxID=114884 RepID=UPI000480BE74|nr:phosphopantetheine-binding protein [Mycoplasmopsis lipofaciens]